MNIIYQKVASDQGRVVDRHLWYVPDHRRSSEPTFGKDFWEHRSSSQIISESAWLWTRDGVHSKTIVTLSLPIPSLAYTFFGT